MDLVGNKDQFITVRFSSGEFVALLRVVSTASQEFENLDRELLDHLTREEVSSLAHGLTHLLDHSSNHV